MTRRQFLAVAALAPAAAPIAKAAAAVRPSAVPAPGRCWRALRVLVSPMKFESEMGREHLIMTGTWTMRFQGLSDDGTWRDIG